MTKTKVEHIDYWLQQAEDDWEAVETLLSGRKNLQALFFAHLTIEKICKAAWIRENSNDIPPKTHNLIFLLSQTSINLKEDQSEFLLNLNRFQIEGRYPDYISKIRQICDDDFTKQMIIKIKEFKLWLLKRMQ